jgi:tRNA-binding protein
MVDSIEWKDFSKVDMRVGTIVKVNDFPEAKKPAYQIHIDFGEEIGIRKCSAQLTSRYSKVQLLNRQVIAVVNFPKKQIANFMSECLILGAVNGQDVVLLHPEKLVANGLKIA